MANFIADENGDYINLDHVSRIAEASRRKGGYVLYDTAGRPLSYVAAAQYGDFVHGVESLIAPVVMAAAGAFVYVISVYGEPGHFEKWGVEGRPVSVEAEKCLVVAWRLGSEFAEPILADDVASNSRVLIAQPDGRVTDPGLYAYDDLEAAKVGVLERAQEHWDTEENRPAD